jgi:hypothetical protein
MRIYKYILGIKGYGKSISICLMLIYIFNSCSSQSQSQVADKLAAGSVTKDIPKDIKGNPKGFYQKKKEIEKMIGLDPLENGFDSMQIRIWYGVALKDKLQLLIMKKSDSKWSAKFYSLELNYDKNRNTLVSVSSNVESKEPISGWSNLADSLYNLNILTLPDSQSINGYGNCNDGDGVTIETATIKSYRIYNYPCFLNQDGIEQAKKIELIMELIEKELRFRRLTVK